MGNPALGGFPCASQYLILPLVLEKAGELASPVPWQRYEV